MGSTLKSLLYKKIDVWKKIDEDTLICFRCYELLGESAFFVQSADFFHLPLSSEQMFSSEKNQVELFLDMAPSERSAAYPTLEEAVMAYEQFFS